MEECVQIPKIGYNKKIDWSSERVQIIGEQFQYFGPYSPISSYVKITDPRSEERRVGKECRL